MKKIAVEAAVLLENIISFWAKLQDVTYGGYYGYMSQELVVDREAEKGCILNSRILWFFSEAAILLKRQELRACAEHAYRFLLEHCLDRENGGVFWSVSFDGSPLDTTKHTYNQAFAIYALSAYFRLTGDAEALSLAEQLFCLVEKNCTDAVGYLESFSRDWKPASNEKLSENGVLADKTMNTLLHVFEGYAGLYQASGEPRVKAALLRILDIYEHQIYDPLLHRQKVFFNARYESILDLYSYGHDIESSWLIDWGTGLLDEPELAKRIYTINTELAQAVYDHAYAGHSLANECENGVVDETRVWWVQAEAVLGFVNLWGKVPEERYRLAARDILQYIKDHMIDPRPGSEWFWCLSPDGTPIPGRPIVEPWKCPYHNGRMCIELIRRNPEIQAPTDESL